MKRLEFVKLGMENVLSSTLRSCLTVLGMAVGVAAILAVITLGEAGRTQVKHEISRLGIDRIQITATEAGSVLNHGDAEYLLQKMQTAVDELLMMECHITTTEKSCTEAVIGCNLDYFQRMNPQITSDTKQPIRQQVFESNAAWVGTSVAAELGLRQGEWFSINGIMFYCCGFMEAGEQACSFDPEEVVLVSLASLRPWVGDMVQQISLTVPSDMGGNEAAKKAEDLLYRRRSVKTTAISMQIQAQAADTVLAVFVDVLKWVAIICMIVGGIGVMNILLVSVRERQREIGIMQSLGAGQMQICSLFLYEALIYAITGGILGLLLGGVLISIAGKSIGIIPVLQARDCTAVFFAAVAIGLISGVIPAMSASFMKPVDALRDE